MPSARQKLRGIPKAESRWNRTDGELRAKEETSCSPRRAGVRGSPRGALQMRRGVSGRADVGAAGLTASYRGAFLRTAGVAHAPSSLACRRVGALLSAQTLTPLSREPTTCLTQAGSTWAQEGESAEPRPLWQRREGFGEPGRAENTRALTPPPSPPEERLSDTSNFRHPQLSPAPGPHTLQKFCPTTAHPPTEPSGYRPTLGTCGHQASPSFVNMTQQPRIATYLRQTENKREREMSR